MRSFCMLALTGLFSVAIWGAYGGKTQEVGTPRPVLIRTCLITGKFPQLVDFYHHVLGIAPRISNGVYAEFPTGEGVLAIFTGEAQDEYIPGSAMPASNKSAILEFKVANVDEEFMRLHNFVKSWVKPPRINRGARAPFIFVIRMEISLIFMRL